MKIFKHDPKTYLYWYSDNREEIRKEIISKQKCFDYDHHCRNSHRCNGYLYRVHSEYTTPHFRCGIEVYEEEEKI